MPEWIQTVAKLNPVTYGVDAARAFVLGEDVLQPFSVTGFGGMWNTIGPSVAILVAINVAFGAVAVYTLHRASSAQVE
jgi:ABC-2 type transport system permease protein